MLKRRHDRDNIAVINDRVSERRQSTYVSFVRGLQMIEVLHAEFAGVVRLIDRIDVPRHFIAIWQVVIITGASVPVQRKSMIGLDFGSRGAPATREWESL